MYPIVIFGGFLSYARMYQDFREGVASITGQSVYVVNVQGYDWIPAINYSGWVKLLDKLDRIVLQAASQSVSGKIILVGHSAGGVLARLYLSPRPFLGQVYHGLDHVGCLITLGSPHYSRGGLRHGGTMSRWMEKHFPGAYFSPQIKYISVAGKYLRGDKNRPGFSRWAYNTYRSLCGDGSAWGDGLIPVESALLKGSEQIILEGISHYRIFGEPWYGSIEAIPLWLKAEWKSITRIG